MEAKILKPTAVEVKAKSCISVYLFVIAYYKVLKKFRLFENFFGKLVYVSCNIGSRVSQVFYIANVCWIEKQESQNKTCNGVFF